MKEKIGILIFIIIIIIFFVSFYPLIVVVDGPNKTHCESLIGLRVNCN